MIVYINNTPYEFNSKKVAATRAMLLKHLATVKSAFTDDGSELYFAYLCNMRMISEEILKNYTVDELDDILSRGYPDDSDKG